MAEKILIDLQVDGEKEINDLKIQLNDLRKTYDALVKSKKEAKNGDRESVEAMKAATKAVADLNASVETYEAKAIQANKATAILNASTEDLGKTATTSANRMKTAFDVVNSTLQVANKSAKEVNSTMLASKFPGAASLGSGESKQLSSAFAQASSFGENKFDMAKVASAAFRGDLTKTTEAIRAYNQMFEQNPGTSAIIQNTSAILNLRTAATSTTGSISAMNKELAMQAKTMSTGIDYVSKYETEIHNLAKSIQLIVTSSMSADEKTDAINAAMYKSSIQIKAIKTTLNETNNAFVTATLSIEELKNKYDELKSKIKQLKAEQHSLKTEIDGGDKTAINKIKEVTAEVENLTNELLTVNTAIDTKAFTTSISGMRVVLASLRKEYSALSDEDRKAARGLELGKTISKQSDLLSVAEAKMAIISQNTANKGFYPLTNSIQQLAREMPNFALSAQIGFSAISNNLPILGDAIKQFNDLRKAQKDAGVEVSSWGKGIKDALLNLPTLLVALSAAFMIFGDKLITYITELIKKIDPLRKLKIEVNTDALKAIQKEAELVFKLQAAIKQLDDLKGEAHQKQLNRIKEVMVEEGILLKSQADNIKTKEQLDDAYFQNYIQKAYEAAYNASIFQKRAEEEIKLKYSKGEADQLEAELIEKTDVSNLVSYGQIDAAKEARRIELEALKETYKEAIKTGKDFQAAWKELVTFGVEDTLLEVYRQQAESEIELNKIAKLDLFKVVLPDKKVDGAGAGAKVKGEGLKTQGAFIPGQIENLDGYYAEYLPKLRDYTNEELAIMSENSQKAQGIYEQGIFGNASFTTIRDTAIMVDLELQREAANKELDLVKSTTEAKINLLTQEIAVTEKAHIEAFNELESYRKLRYDKETEIFEAEKALDRAKTAESKRIAAINLQVLKDGLALLDKEVEEKQKAYEKLKSDRDKYIEQLKAAMDPTEVERLTEAIKVLNTQISMQGETIRLDKYDEWIEKLTAVRDVMATIGEVYGGLASAQQAEMDTINSKYDEEAWQIQESITNNEAREKALYDLEMKRYEALVVAFEMKKKYDEGQVWAELAVTYMNSAAGIVAAWKEETPIAILKTAAIGVSTIAATIQAAASVKSIRAQRLEKPHKPANTGNGANYMALNPSSTALTTKEENLNTIASSNTKSAPVSVVKVSDINNVQETVAVRDRNSNY